MKRRLRYSKVLVVFTAKPKPLTEEEIRYAMSIGSLSGIPSRDPRYRCERGYETDVARDALEEIRSIYGFGSDEYKIAKQCYERISADYKWVTE